jgi:hypothetical protein
MDRQELDELLGTRLLPSYVNRGSKIVVMPFGRYRGQPLHNIPTGYLGWALKSVANLQPDLRRAIKACLGTQADDD